MKTKRSQTNAALRQVEHSSDRSTLFYWMLEQHDALIARAKGRKMRWSELCVTFEQLGLTNQQGETANELTARITWYRVRKEVARLLAYEVAQASRPAKAPAARSLMPSASPRERVPIEYPRLQHLLPKPAEPSGPASPTDGSPAQSRADATIARMKRHFAERDGRKPPSS